jgi:hypothetical protein
MTTVSRSVPDLGCPMVKGVLSAGSHLAGYLLVACHIARRRRSRPSREGLVEVPPIIKRFSKGPVIPALAQDTPRGALPFGSLDVPYKRRNLECTLARLGRTRFGQHGPLRPADMIRDLFGWHPQLDRNYLHPLSERAVHTAAWEQGAAYRTLASRAPVSS